MTRRRQGRLALYALGLAAVLLVAVELLAGGLDYGESKLADPCRDRRAFPGEGFQAALQRIVLDGLDGAACDLGTTREELVLSIDSTRSRGVDWDSEQLERSLRSGLLEAIDDAEARGGIGGFEARTLRALVQRAPLDWLIQGGSSVAGQLGALFGRR